MDYNKLHTFLYVAKLGSISKAASNLFLSQQAVSQQMAALEDELGLSLLKRLHNRIYLSREGEALYDFAQSRYRELDDFVLSIKESTEEIEGQIRLGCMGEYAARFISPSIARFKLAHPRVKFLIQLAPDYEIEQAIINNQIDIGLLINYRNKALLAHEAFQTEDFVLVCTPDFAAKHGPFVDAQSVMKAPFVDYTQNLGGFGRWLRQNYKKQAKYLGELIPDIVVENDSMARKFILQGTVIGFLTQSVIGDDIDAGRLVQVLPHSIPVQTQTDLVQLKKRSANLALDRFVETLHECKNLGELVG